MKIIGITGRMGSGKSVLSRHFAKRGAEVVDADNIAHSVLLKGGPAYKGVIEAFGEEVLGADGEIDRKRLGQAVFNDVEKLLALNALTHKHIIAEIERRLDGCEAPWAVLDAALLFESGLDEACDVTVAVTAPESQRLSRVIQRDGLPKEAAEARIKSQYKHDDPASLSDYVLENNTDMEQFIIRAESLAQRLLT